MSKKEVSRRETCRRVMNYAHMLFRKSGGWTDFKACLKLAWKMIKDAMRCLIRSTVKGVTFENSNKVNRQMVIQRLASYDPDDVSLFFKRESENLYDENAVCVMASVRSKGVAQLGYLGKEEARIVGPILDKGHHALVFLEKIIGGGDLNYGVVLSYALE